jgi:HD-GYP domain-containing protein (c-di-GMP phosphodiesterase class II)
LFHLQKHEMLPFIVANLVTGSTTDFDLYIETGAMMTLYAKAPYQWNQDEMTRLMEAGQTALFYVTRDRHLVEAYRLAQAVSDPGADLPPHERILKVTDAAAELTRVLYQYKVTVSTIERVRGLARSLVTCIEEDPTCVAALGKLAHHDFYTYFHSARVSAHAVAIAVRLGQRDSVQLVEMATGGLLHDIGKSQIDLNVLNKPGSLSAEEWTLIKQHPLFGESLVQDSQLSAVPRQIILSHHERFDGSGYPHRLTEREMLEEVKIAAFADTFDALTTNRPYQESRTPFEALDLIKNRLLKNLHADSYHAMVDLLSRGERTVIAG